VPSRKDTLTGLKKIALIDNFSLTTAYDFSRDSLRWSLLAMSGRTRLFKGVDISYSSAWDPYIQDSSGTKRLNQYEWKVNRRLFRHENTSWTLGISYNLNQQSFKKKSEKGSEQEREEVELYPDDFIDWNQPWRFSLNYNFRYNLDDAYPGYIRTRTNQVVQTVSINGEVNITPKWKVGMNSGYDFTQKKVSYTNVSIYRDLHCWQMRFSWIPLGPRKSWNFSINAKSSLLQDLKLDKKKDFRDDF